MFYRLFIFVFICNLSISDATCPAHYVYQRGVSRYEANLITDWHNYYRLLIAQGLVRGQPKASNMRRLKWDSRLAIRAQSIANTCIYGHVPVSDSRWFSVGQNIYISYRTAYSRTSNWSAVIKAWFDEVSLYRYPNRFSDATGDYTQIVNADTVALGCGYISFYDPVNKFYKQYYICNYGPAGNVNNNPPYKTGAGCKNLC